jgi:hypothetical protein
MLDERFISFSHAPGFLGLVGVPIVVDKADLPGVHIAARNLSVDFARVTQRASSPLKFVTNEYDGFKKEAETAIIVGSIETSSLLQSLEKSGRLDFNNIRGKWESYMTTIVENPFEGYHKALVIAGSDKRGAIFGVYALSEQIGVSPYSSFSHLLHFYHYKAKIDTGGIGGLMSFLNFTRKSMRFL